MDPIVQDEKRRFQQVVSKIRKEYGATTEEIARHAGVHQSTLYRWLSKTRNEVPTTLQFRQIVRAFAVDDESVMPAPHMALRKLADNSIAIFRLKEGPSITRWVVNDRRLELCGLLPDDVVEIDGTLAAQQGDLVLLQLKGKDPEPRKLAGNVAITRTMDEDVDQEPIVWRNNPAVNILGVIVRSIRSYRS